MTLTELLADLQALLEHPETKRCSVSIVVQEINDVAGHASASHFPLAAVQLYRGEVLLIADVEVDDVQAMQTMREGTGMH